MGQGLDNASLLSVIQTQEQIVASGLNLEAVMDLVVERAQALTEASAGVIEMVDGDDMVYTAVAGTAEGHSGLRLKVGGSLSGTSVVENEVLHCSDARRDGRVDRAAAERLGAISVVCAPLLHQGRPVGVLKVYDPEPRAFSDADVTIIGLLSRVIASHMAHATDFEAAHRDGRHDGLTGLPNRRFFDEHLNGEVARARRLGSPLTLCLFDLDGFKGLNDRLGHAAGDRVLRAIAHTFDSIRAGDIAFRIGGDEFALLLPGANEADAERVAYRIAAAIAGNDDCLGMTSSWGAATLEEASPEQFLTRADAALYAAKRALAIVG